MKKLTVMFFALILLFSAQLSYAANDSNSTKYEKGTIRYHEFFDEAIANPGMPILVRQREQLKLKSIFKEVVKIEEGFIVYDKDEDRMSFQETKREKDERESFLIIISILVSILIIGLNIAIKRGHNLDFWLRILLILILVGLFVLAILTIKSFVFLAFALALFLSFIAVRNGDTELENKKEILAIMIVATYLLVAIHFAFLFVLA
jgi:K+-sensing histidine kinase KdpD